MKFKPGDQVSFLNAVGGGVVVSIGKSGSLKVAMEDGFDITCFEHELALVKSAEKPAAGAPASSGSVEPLPLKEKLTEAPPNVIAFFALPAHENRVLTGDVAFQLANTTPYAISFVLTYVQDKEHHLLHAGMLQSGEEFPAGTFPRPALTDWDHLHIQVLFYGTVPFRFLPAIQKDIPVLLPDLSGSGKEKGRLAFARQFIVFRYVTDDEIPDTSLLKDKLFSPSAIKSPARQAAKKAKNPSVDDDGRYGIYRNTKEVDLHMDEKEAGSGDEMHLLELQLKRFHKEMDLAILHHYHSIVFIHGVGEGVLRKAIIEELDHYKGISWRNGDYQKYGAGAIEIIFV